MAKLFGASINVVEPEEQRNGEYGDVNTVPDVNTVSGEVSRSGAQPNGEAMRESEIGVCNPYFSFLESNSDSGSVSMDSGPDPHNCFIDFFDRESYEVETVRETHISPMRRVSNTCDFDIWGFLDTEEDIDLGLGIGSGSGSGSGREVIEIDSDSDDENREIESGGVEIGGEAMVVDEVLEWEDLQNAVDLIQPVELDWIQPEEDSEVLSFVAQVQDQHQLHVFSDDYFMVNSAVMMDFDFSIVLDSMLEGLNEHHGEEDYNAMFDNESVVMGSPPASKKVVEDLPVVEITCEEGIVCAICKDEVVVKEKVTRLPCRHYYHGECIVPWLGIRNTCPVCRYELPTDDVEYETHRRLQRRRLERTN